MYFGGFVCMIYTPICYRVYCTEKMKFSFMHNSLAVVILFSVMKTPFYKNAATPYNSNQHNKHLRCMYTVSCIFCIDQGSE